jgi:DNA-binding NarL/FixJ family response regulator
VGSIRVLIADDHSLFAKTLEALLAGAGGIEVVGTAADGLEAVALSATLCPDIVLMDVEMPHLDGFAATRRLCELGLGTSVIVLTASGDAEKSQLASEAGALGFLTKDRIGEALVPAILSVAGASARLSADGSADLAGRARVG